MKLMLKCFIEEKWAAFRSYCRDGGDESMADEIIVALGGEPE